MPSAALTGAAAASGLALVNFLGNLGGFVAPYAVGLLKDATGSNQSGAVPLLLPVRHRSGHLPLRPQAPRRRRPPLPRSPRRPPSNPPTSPNPELPEGTFPMTSVTPFPTERTVVRARCRVGTRHRPCGRRPSGRAEGWSIASLTSTPRTPSPQPPNSVRPGRQAIGVGADVSTSRRWTAPSRRSRARCPRSWPSPTWPA